MQKELEVLKSGRVQYAHDPYGLIAKSHGGGGVRHHCRGEQLPVVLKLIVPRDFAAGR